MLRLERGVGLAITTLDKLMPRLRLEVGGVGSAIATLDKKAGRPEGL